jgi:hypothetical protein
MRSLPSASSPHRTFARRSNRLERFENRRGPVPLLEQRGGDLDHLGVQSGDTGITRNCRTRGRLVVHRIADHQAGLSSEPPLPRKISSEPSLKVGLRSAVKILIEPSAKEASEHTTLCRASLGERDQHVVHEDPLRAAFEYGDVLLGNPGLG